MAFAGILLIVRAVLPMHAPYGDVVSQHPTTHDQHR